MRRPLAILPGLATAACGPRSFTRDKHMDPQEAARRRQALPKDPFRALGTSETLVYRR